MKTFKQYLMENKKEYKFRIKYAGTFSEIDKTKLEITVGKYNLIEITNPKVTPIQEHPMDFQILRNTEVTIVDVVVGYPTTAEILRNELSTFAGFNASRMVVINSDNPTEISREETLENADIEYETKLLDNDYKDSADVKAEELYGDKYNENLLKELTKERETPEIEIAGDMKEEPKKKKAKKEKKSDGK